MRRNSRDRYIYIYIHNKRSDEDDKMASGITVDHERKAK